MSHPNARLTGHGRLLLCRRLEGKGWRAAQTRRLIAAGRRRQRSW